MEIVVVSPPVSQAVNEPRVAVKSKHYRLVGREDGVEIPIGQPVRMFVGRLQRHQVDHVDYSNFDIGHTLAQQIYSGQSLERWHVATARHDDIRISALIATRPFPYA